MLDLWGWVLRGALGVAVSAYFLSGIAVKKIVGCGVAVNLNPTVCGILFSRMWYCGEKDLKWRFYGVDKFCGVRHFGLIVALPINCFQIGGRHLFLCAYIRKSTCISGSELFATFVTKYKFA